MQTKVDKDLMVSGLDPPRLEPKMAMYSLSSILELTIIILLRIDNRWQALRGCTMSKQEAYRCQLHSLYSGIALMGLNPLGHHQIHGLSSLVVIAKVYQTRKDLPVTLRILLMIFYVVSWTYFLDTNSQGCKPNMGTLILTVSCIIITKTSHLRIYLKLSVESAKKKLREDNEQSGLKRKPQIGYPLSKLIRSIVRRLKINQSHLVARCALTTQNCLKRACSCHVAISFTLIA